MIAKVFLHLQTTYVLSENAKEFFLVSLSSASNGSYVAIRSSKYKTLKDFRGKTIKEQHYFIWNPDSKHFLNRFQLSSSLAFTISHS